MGCWITYKCHCYLYTVLNGSGVIVLLIAEEGKALWGLAFGDLVFLGIVVRLRGPTHTYIFVFGCDGTSTHQSLPSGPPRKVKMWLAPSLDANVLLSQVNGRHVEFAFMWQPSCFFVVVARTDEIWTRGWWYWLDLTENPSALHGRDDPRRIHALKPLKSILSSILNGTIIYKNDHPAVLKKS